MPPAPAPAPTPTPTPARRTFAGPRTRAIVFTGALFYGLLLLDNLSLRGILPLPTAAPFWATLYVAGVIVIAYVLGRRASADGRAGRTVVTTVIAAVVWFAVGGVIYQPGQEREVTVGPRGFKSGGGFTHDVGSQYGKPQLERTLAAFNAVPASSFDQFMCDDESAPHMTFSLTLEPEREDRDRLVSVGYAPAVDVVDDRCLAFGISFLADSVFEGIDTGPRIDYGYVDPRTGKRLGPYVESPPRKPICRCDLRASGREWVAWSEEAAAELK